MSDFITLNFKEIQNIIEKKRNNLFERYKLDEAILEKYVNKDEYLKSDLDYVYFISTLINSFYSTRMGGHRIYAVSQFISNYNDITTLEQVINIISSSQKSKIQIAKNGRKFCPYSFLTKYYAIHNRIINGCKYSEIPIYDNSVDKSLKVIIHYVKNNKNDKYSNEFVKGISKYFIKDIKNNKLFCEMIRLIRDEIDKSNYTNQPVTYTNVDNYFWLLQQNNDNIL